MIIFARTTVNSLVRLSLPNTEEDTLMDLCDRTMAVLAHSLLQ